MQNFCDLGVMLLLRCKVLLSVQLIMLDFVPVFAVNFVVCVVGLAVVYRYQRTVLLPFPILMFFFKNRVETTLVRKSLL